MTKKNCKNNSRLDTKPKKPAYISFNMEELNALETLGFRERWTYISLKVCANFKTGVVGEFMNQKLSYVDIAAMVKAPPGVQGRGEGGIDDTQAREFLCRMEAAGLVSGIARRANGGLRFVLPMSPITFKKIDQTEQRAGEKAGNPEILSGEKTIIFPDEATPQNLASRVTDSHSEESLHLLSVMINTKTNINTESSGPSYDGAEPCRAEGATPLRENPPEVAGVPAPLTSQQIYSALSDTWTFTETNTDAAWQLYEAWAGAITLDDLHAAMTSVEERPECPDPTPADLAPMLWAATVDHGLSQSSA